MNTIKTKIGFDTKPIYTIDFYGLFNISSKVYANSLLLLGILLSTFNLACSISLQNRQKHQLHTLQQETNQLEKTQKTLTTEYELLISSNRLKSLSTSIKMHPPSQQETIYLPKDQNK
jgi:sensor domain CHASE-containing protein